jgi:hypothetical protein
VLLELSAQKALLRRQVAELSERLAKQDERIAELERRLKRNSRNSSLPPARINPPPLSAGKLLRRGTGGAPSRAIRDAVVIRRRSRRSTSYSTTGPLAAAAATSSARRSARRSGSPRAIRSRSCRRPPRGPGAARRGLPGVACADRWWAYDYLDAERRQLCWAHLVRDFTAHSEGLGAQKEFGAAGLRVAGRLFAAWAEFRRDADRNRLLERVGPLKEELRALLEEAARKAARNRRHRPVAKNLLKRWPALWSFASVPGVEPTNNHAERGLRGAVILRKLSHGSQSAQGERTIDRLLPASVTCRLQGRSLFAYLSDVLAAKIRGDPIPLLA